jgi:hypothetical protein
MQPPVYRPSTTTPPVPAGSRKAASVLQQKPQSLSPVTPGAPPVYRPNMLLQTKAVSSSGAPPVYNPFKVSGPVLQRRMAAHSQVIQMKPCDKCGAKVTGKGRLCADCERLVPKEKLGYGDWWESIGGNRRQELLRAYGSHETYGGVLQNDQGSKPDEHSRGQSNATKRIRKLYEADKLS